MLCIRFRHCPRPFGDGLLYNGSSTYTESVAGSAADVERGYRLPGVLL